MNLEHLTKDCFIASFYDDWDVVTQLQFRQLLEQVTAIIGDFDMSRGRPGIRCGYRELTSSQMTKHFFSIAINSAGFSLEINRRNAQLNYSELHSEIGEDEKSYYLFRGENANDDVEEFLSFLSLNRESISTQLPNDRDGYRPMDYMIDKDCQHAFQHLSNISRIRKNQLEWTDETRNSFLRMLMLANEAGLDSFEISKNTLSKINIGYRTPKGETAVCATFNPKEKGINFITHADLGLSAELNGNVSPELLEKLKYSKLFDRFKEKRSLNSISEQQRTPYWPNDYMKFTNSQNVSLPNHKDKEPTMQVNSPLNQILYGPPGTGKTYHTIEAAVTAAEPSFTWKTRSELKTKYDELVAAKRIRFVTFHQSYGYEEFVEGLKAKTTEDKSIEYVVESGVFKAIVEDAKSSDLRKVFEVNADATIWKISIDGTGQSHVSNYCLANGLAAIGWGEAGDLLAEDLDSNEYYQGLGTQEKSSLSEFSQRASAGDLILCIGSQRTVQALGVIAGDYYFEQAGTSEYDHYCNQLPVNWLVTDIDVDFHELNGGVNFTQKTFYELWRFSVSDVFDLLKRQGVEVNTVKTVQEVENYVLVIDEINRGNISKIFGELITLIEPSKRMPANRKPTDEFLEINLPHSTSLFSVPDNLYLIGTMNTADRSLAMMDTALRRRFDFVEMMPKPELLKGAVVNGIDLERLLKVLNERIEILYDREHTLGHAFFMPVKNKLEDEKQKHLAFSELVSVFQNKIIPLLEEYFFEDWEKIRLVLADNQKPEHLQLVTKTSLEQTVLKQLFGDSHGLNSFGETYQQYSLKEHESDVWQNAKAFIGIYEPGSVQEAKLSDAANTQPDETKSEPEPSEA